MAHLLSVQEVYRFLDGASAPVLYSRAAGLPLAVRLSPSGLCLVNTDCYYAPENRDYDTLLYCLHSECCMPGSFSALEAIGGTSLLLWRLLDVDPTPAAGRLSTWPGYYGARAGELLTLFATGRCYVLLASRRNSPTLAFVLRQPAVELAEALEYMTVPVAATCLPPGVARVLAGFVLFDTANLLYALSGRLPEADLDTVWALPGRIPLPWSELGSLVPLSFEADRLALVEGRVYISGGFGVSSPGSCRVWRAVYDHWYEVIPPAVAGLYNVSCDPASQAPKY